MSRDPSDIIPFKKKFWDIQIYVAAQGSHCGMNLGSILPHFESHSALLLSFYYVLIKYDATCLKEYFIWSLKTLEYILFYHFLDKDTTISKSNLTKVSNSYLVDPSLEPESLIYCQGVHRYFIVVNSVTLKGCGKTTIIKSKIWISENEHYKEILKKWSLLSWREHIFVRLEQICSWEDKGMDSIPCQGPLTWYYISLQF